MRWQWFFSLLILTAMARGEGGEGDFRVVNVRPAVIDSGETVRVQVQPPQKGAWTVTFDGIPGEVASSRGDMAVVVVPDLGKIAPGDTLRVECSVGGRTSNWFRVVRREPPLSITGVSKARAKPGARIWLDLSREVQDPKVEFQGVPASVVGRDGNRIQVEVPELAAPDAFITVYDGDEKSLSYDGFRADVPGPGGEGGTPLLWTLGVLLLAGAVVVYLGSRRSRRRARDLKRQLEGARFELQYGEGPWEERGGEAVQAPPAPDELRRACREGSCVLFSGVGLSAQAGYPTWRELLGQLARIGEERAGEGEGPLWEGVRGAIKAGDLEAAAETLDSVLPQEVLWREVGRAYGQHGPRVKDLLPLLGRIPFRGAVTTAWDRVLEEAFQQRSPQVRLNFEASDLASLERRRDPTFVILKLQGGLDREEGRSFSTRKLGSQLVQNYDLKKYIGSQFASRTVLFLGMSLDAMEQVLDACGMTSPTGQRHYALVPRGRGTPVTRQLFLDRYGIELIPFEPTPGEPQVREFLRGLADEQKEGGTVRADVQRAVLESVQLTNIGPFGTLDLPLVPGWNVLLGNNGCGKSTILKAIAAGLCGDNDRAKRAARPLLRRGENLRRGSVSLRISGRQFETELTREGAHIAVRSKQVTPLEAGNWVVLGFPPLRGAFTGSVQDPDVADTDGSPDPEVDDLLPLLVGSIDQRMDSLRQWLFNTHLRAEEKGPRGERYGNLLQSFYRLLSSLTEGVLLERGRIDRKALAVEVKTADGFVPIEVVSQGMSSIMSWTGYLLQRLYEIYADAERPDHQPALVLVDELDAHMHPAWQSILVPRLKELFPQLQVIATTHSPLIVGNMEKSEILMVRREEGGEVTVQGAETSFRGWRADQILTSAAFDLETSRDQATRELQSRYVELAGRANLSPAEETEFAEAGRQLGETVPSAGERQEARDAYDLLKKALDEQVAAMPPEQRKRVMEEVRLQLQRAFEEPK